MRAIGAALALILAAGLAGCAGGSDLDNKKDHFSYEMGGAGMSADQTWYWDTDGGDIRIRISMGGAGGSAELTVKDPEGRVVFHESMSGTGGRDRDTTLHNMPAGSWEIMLEASGITGGLDIDIDRV